MVAKLLKKKKGRKKKECNGDKKEEGCQMVYKNLLEQ